MSDNLKNYIRWLKDKDLLILFYKNYIDHPNMYGRKYSFFECIEKAFEHTGNPINSLYKGWSVDYANENREFWLNKLYDDKYHYDKYYRYYI